MDREVKSENFWTCTNVTVNTGPIDIVIFITEIVGLIPSTIAIYLLCRLDGKTRTSLLMLRTLTVCTFFQILTNFVGDIYPYQVQTSNLTFNYIVCIFWTSRFVYWIFSVIAIHAQVFFSTNRTMQIAANLQLSFASSRNIDLVYIAGLVAYSLLITIPQVFTIVYTEDSCYCGDDYIDPTLLQLTFAQNYVYFFQVLLMNAIVQAASCYLVIKWVKHTPRESFMDTLNALSFSHTSEEELKMYSEIKGWSTSSMCIVPMFMSFFISFAYDTTYQFVSAIGLVRYEIDSITQKVGIWILLIHPTLVPYYLFYYIPAMRFWALGKFNAIRNVFFGGHRSMMMGRKK